MNRAGRLTVVMACALLVNCSAPSENPLANGLTEEQQTLLIERTIDQIESTEQYTPDNFEQRRRAHIETMTEEMRDPALEHLPKRLDKIVMLEMSQTVELDRDSVELESRAASPEQVMALVTVNGNRTYRTNNASRTTETQFALAWIIMLDGGDLVFRHRGIRMREIRD